MEKRFIHKSIPHKPPTLPGGYMGKIYASTLPPGCCAMRICPKTHLKKLSADRHWHYILMNGSLRDAVRTGKQSGLMTGPLTGNGFTPGGTKMTAVYLSPLTNTTLGRGATSGYWATYLKASGYDGIILTGASLKPVYLYINEGKTELRDAANFWGLGTRATEDRLRESVGHREAKVLCIGPAGENLNRAAMSPTTTITSPLTAAARFGSKSSKDRRTHRAPSFRDKAKLVDAGWRWRKPRAA
jgi:aldehyde:ferredoxin oxidoreductase